MPFAPGEGETTVATVTPQTGGSLTSSAGASIRFPSGAFAQATDVSLAPATAPEADATGTSVSRGFEITPGGAELEAPASVELTFDREADPSRSWLAALRLVTPEGVQEVGDTWVDLNAGLVEGRISTLGTMAVVLPDPDAVFVSGRAGAAASLAPLTMALLPTGTDSVTVDCGSREGRCADLTLASTDDLWERFTLAAAIFPKVKGGLKLEGGRATGEITLTSSIRLLLPSGASAVNLKMHGVLRPTDATRVVEDENTITLTNTRVQVGSRPDGADGPEVVTRDFVITKSGGRGFAALSRSVTLPDQGNGPERTSISVNFPVQIHQ